MICKNTVMEYNLQTFKSLGIFLGNVTIKCEEIKPKIRK